MVEVVPRTGQASQVPLFTRALVAQVNDFSADAIISQLLLLDSQDPSKVC